MPLTIEELQALEKEWWYPVPTDKKWCDEIRMDNAEDIREGTEDEDLVDRYNDGLKYQRLWDHIGDAYEQFEPLADAFFSMRQQLIDLLSKERKT